MSRLKEMALAKALGGGKKTPSLPRKIVNLTDLKGNVWKNFEKAEFLALTELPDPPTEPGLTPNGWNWTLPEAQNYVGGVGENAVVDIAPQYDPEDGKMHIIWECVEGRQSPYLGICPNGTVDIDWGDNTPHSTLTGSSTSTLAYAYHEYAEPGMYDITIDTEGQIGIKGSSAKGMLLFGRGPTDMYNEINQVYSGGIKKIILSNKVTAIGDAAFASFYSLERVIFSSESNITTIGGASFENTKSLKSVIIPNGVTTLSSAFLGSGIESITLPNSLTTISTSAFKNCKNLKEIILPNKITSLAHSTFMGCDSLESITFPTMLKTVNGSTSSGSGGAIQGCYSLKNLTFPGGLRELTYYACEGLARTPIVTLPENVNKIMAGAFINCRSIKEYRCLPIDIPQITSANPFSIRHDTVFYVPEEKLSGYKAVGNLSNCVEAMVGFKTHYRATKIAKYIDADQGWLGDGVWHPFAEPIHRSDIYAVEAGKHYEFGLGEVVGGYFRVMFTTEDVTIATANVTGIQIGADITSPSANLKRRFTPPTDGYIAILKDANSVDGIQTTMNEITYEFPPAPWLINYFPKTADGTWPVYDMNKPFKVHIKVKCSALTGKSQVLFGNNQSFMWMPSVEFQNSSATNLLWAGWSTNGTSWGSNTTITKSELAFTADTWYTIEYGWDGTTATLTATDGTTSVTKTFAASKFYSVSPNEGSRMQIGGIAQSNDHVARNCTFDLDDCYYEQDGVILWGNKL